MVDAGSCFRVPMRVTLLTFDAGVAKLVDAPDLGSGI